jgi:hypothetical protein
LGSGKFEPNPAESFGQAISSKQSVISSQKQLISGKIRLYRERYQRQ